MPHPKLTGGLVLAIFVIGGGLYLLIEKPLFFWLVLVPIVVLIFLAIIGNNRKK